MPIQTAIDSISNSQGSPFGFKNRIINGAMVIDQRNAGASVTAGTGNPYTVDRWVSISSQNSKYTIQQNAGSVTPPEGFTYYLGITSSSAYTVDSAEQFLVRQQIEGYNIADLNWGSANAKTVTLSFWVRSSLTGTFGGGLYNNDGSRSYPFSYTISTANTWEQKSVTIAGDTSGTWQTTTSTGVSVGFGLGVGSTYSGTAGAWAGTYYGSATGATSVVGTNGATFYITGVQLEKGTQATAFDYRDYGRELVLCQRYFTSTAYGVQNHNLDTCLDHIAYTADNTHGERFPVRMRAAPSVTLYGRTSTAGYVTRTDNGANLGSTSAANSISATVFRRIVLGSGLAGGYPALAIEVSYQADAEL